MVAIDFWTFLKCPKSVYPLEMFATGVLVTILQWFACFLLRSHCIKMTA